MAECQGMFKMQHDLDKVLAEASAFLHLSSLLRFAPKQSPAALNARSHQDLKFTHVFPRTCALPPPMDADLADDEAAVSGEANGAWTLLFLPLALLFWGS